MNASSMNNVAAIAAALKDRDEMGSGPSKRGSLNLKTAASTRDPEVGEYGSSSRDLDSMGRLSGNNENFDEEAMDDEGSVVEDDFLPIVTASTGSKARARRASEGSYLTKGESRRSSGELRCEKCGKGYKHSSCLTKHLSVLPGLPVIQLFASTLFHCASVILVRSIFSETYFTPISRSSIVDVWYLQVGAYS